MERSFYANFSRGWDPLNSAIADAAPIEPQAGMSFPSRDALAAAMALVVVLHAVLIAVLQPQAIAASRYATVAIVLLATTCVWLRGQRVQLRERSMLRWLSASILLWGVAHLVETILGPPSAASSLAVDASDLIYVVAAFPLLLALSTTRETEPHRSIFFLNCGQMGLATLLTYVLLFRTPMTPQAASTMMGTNELSAGYERHLRTAQAKAARRGNRMAKQLA